MILISEASRKRLLNFSEAKMRCRSIVDAARQPWSGCDDRTVGVRHFQPPILIVVEMSAGRAHFRCAFRNLTQRTGRKATKSTEGLMEKKMSTGRKEKG